MKRRILFILVSVFLLFACADKQTQTSTAEEINPINIIKETVIDTVHITIFRQASSLCVLARSETSISISCR